MPEYGMPFDFDPDALDSEEYQYNATEQRMFNMAMFTNGVFPQSRIIQGSVMDPIIYVGQSLKVSAGPGLQVIVSKGMAALEGLMYWNTENKVISLESGIAKTFDIIVESNLITQKVTAKAQLRASGALPKDALTRSNYLYQLLIATITLPANATSISESNITDHRLNTALATSDGKPVCGLVNSNLQADTRIIHDQYLAMLQENKTVFEMWFSGLQAILDTNVAANLLNQINALDASKAAKNEVEAKADKVRIISLILTVASWAGTSPPFSQTRTVTGYDPLKKYARNGFSEAVSEAQMAEYGKCMIKMAGKALNSITFHAMKKKPEIDIPVLIEVGDMYVG